MKQTEQYLRQATQGLWGRARRDLRTELQGHVNERIQEFRLGGLSMEEAERLTLRELGTPERVSSGMLGVHTVPALGKAGALSLLLATTLLTALPQGSAQVKSLYGSLPNIGPASYLDFKQLKAALEKAGGELSGQPDAAFITVPNTLHPHYPLNTTQWPGALLIRENRTYLNTNILMAGLQNSGADLWVVGWKNPTLRAGTTDIHIDTDDVHVAGDLYANTIISIAPSNVKGIVFSPNMNVSDRSLVFKGEFKKDGIYALITPQLTYWSWKNQDSTVSDGYVFLTPSVSQAQAGKIQFAVNKDLVYSRLYSNMRDFQAALYPYRSVARAPVAHWDAAHPAPVLILELSGHFGPDAYKVVDPSAAHIK